MSEMIERVAAALQAAEWGDGLPEPWVTCDEESKAEYRRLAKVAIEAMREPTETMMNSLPACHSSSFKEIWPLICADIHRAMIDAALKDPA